MVVQFLQVGSISILTVWVSLLASSKERNQQDRSHSTQTCHMSHGGNDLAPGRAAWTLPADMQHLSRQPQPPFHWCGIPAVCLPSTGMQTHDLEVSSASRTPNPPPLAVLPAALIPYQEHMCYQYVHMKKACQGRLKPQTVFIVRLFFPFIYPFFSLSARVVRFWYD